MTFRPGDTVEYRETYGNSWHEGRVVGTGSDRCGDYVRLINGREQTRFIRPANVRAKVAT